MRAVPTQLPLASTTSSKTGKNHFCIRGAEIPYQEGRLLSHQEIVHTL